MTVYTDISQVPLFKYHLIMADNPWRFQNYGRPNERSAEAHYRTMTTDEIMDLPVSDIAAGECWLWLWATNAMLPQAVDVMRAWGFQYVTAGTWGKVQKADPTQPKLGLGHVLRDASEPYLIGKIGNPQVYDRAIPTLILESKRAHSEKPEKGYRNAERLAHPNAFRIELFSRKEREGWDVMGNEVGALERA